MKTIETIKQMIADGQISQEVAEKYFPELRESEDERIRKELVDFIYDKTDTYELREKSNSWLAWIEKQGEQKPVPDWMPKFLDELRSKKNYFDWDEHKDIEGRILAIIQWMNPNYFIGKDGEQKSDNGESSFLTVERAKEVSPFTRNGPENEFVGWSEEDEKMFNKIAAHLNATCSGFPEDEKWASKFLNWLKSLKERVQPQPKQEWSEEDEGLLKWTINNLTELEQRFGKDYGKVGKCIDWIKQKRWKKSLKTADLENSLCDIQDGYSDTSYEYRVLGEAIEFIRSTDDPRAWKPNEEQLRVLTWCTLFCDPRPKEILESLIDDLKRL